MKYKTCFTFLLFTIFLNVDLFAGSIQVASLIEFERAQEKSNAGDSIIWKIGSYKDLTLKLTKNKIFVIAEKPGSTVFTGSSTLAVLGDGNTISGFQFLGGFIKGDVLDISGNNNRIEQINIQNYDSHYYLRIRPNCRYNVVSYCNFQSKPETQESSVVQVEAAEGLPGYHLITHCSFKNHTAPPGAGGDYGIEALRIGYSYQAKFISRTIVEYCYFTKCNGDGEIISNKARENVFRYNTFENNGESHFTLRHAKDNVVYGNFFIGGAGIRIKEGQNQMVYNNYFQTGKYFSVMLVNYKADPLENIVITHNTFVSSGVIQLGAKGDFDPQKVQLVNNLFLNPTNNLILDSTGNERFSGNVTNSSFEHLPKGFSWVEVKSEKNNFGLLQPIEDGNLQKFFCFESPKLLDIPILDDDPLIVLDIMKQGRKIKKQSTIGCFIPEANSKIRFHATKNNTGPDYLI